MDYLAASRILRLFSANSVTRTAYQWLGRVRSLLADDAEIAPKYFYRTPILLEALRRHDILTPDMDVLEIGTGWVHWEALMVRNEVDCRASLYDVVDNRRPARMRRYLMHLAKPDVRRKLGLNDDAAALMRRSAQAVSRQERYELLGFDYHADPTGRLEGIANTGFDLVISSDVGEHLRLEDAPQIVQRMYDLTRPGGWGYHLIVLSDHLTIYAKDAHDKQYLTYSRDDFMARINNGVQYVNTLQASEFAGMFETAGFEIVERNALATCDLSTIKVHPSWGGFDQEDLETKILQIVVLRPAKS